MYTPQLPLARASSSSSETPHADPGGLEASLLQLVHDHHHTSLRLRDHTGQPLNQKLWLDRVYKFTRIAIYLFIFVI